MLSGPRRVGGRLLTLLHLICSTATLRERYATLFHYLQNQQWHFRLRLKGNTLVHLEAGLASPVKELCPPAGSKSLFHKRWIFWGAGWATIFGVCSLF